MDLCMWGPQGSAGPQRTPPPRPLPRSAPPLRLRAPRPKPPPYCPRRFRSGARPGQGRLAGPEARPCCPLPGIGAVRTGSERWIRGLWSVDANRLRRAQAEDRGPEGAADSSRKWPRRLRGAAARAVGARAPWGARAAGKGRAALQEFASRERWELVAGQRGPLSAFLAKCPETRRPKCGALAFSQVLWSRNEFLRIGTFWTKRTDKSLLFFSSLCEEASSEPALPLWRSLQGTFSTLLGSASFPAPEVAPQDLGVGGVQPSLKLRKTVTSTPLSTRLAALELRNFGPALLALGWLTQKLVRWCSPKWTCQIPDFTATYTVFSGAVYSVLMPWNNWLSLVPWLQGLWS